MIYTVTFNPAIDYIVRMPEFIAGATNRVNYEQVLGGGRYKRFYRIEKSWY